MCRASDVSEYAFGAEREFYTSKCYRISPISALTSTELKVNSRRWAIIGYSTLDNELFSPHKTC